MAFEFVGFYASVASMVPTLCLFIGSCWLLKSIAKDIPLDLSFLALSECHTRSCSSRIAICQRFSTAIQCFSDVKQLSSDKFTSMTILLFFDCNLSICIFRLVNDFKGIFRFIIVAIYLYSISNICGALLSLQAQLVEYFTFFF